MNLSSLPNILEIIWCIFVTMLASIYKIIVGSVLKFSCGRKKPLYNWSIKVVTVEIISNAIAVFSEGTQFSTLSD